MVTYGGTKVFDMVFTEGLWMELHNKGVDVLGLVLGMTDTPALRQLEFEHGSLASLDEVLQGAVTAASVVDEALANLGNGPTVATADDVRMGLELFRSMSRNEVVRLIMQAGAAVLGPTRDKAVRRHDVHSSIRHAGSLDRCTADRAVRRGK